MEGICIWSPTRKRCARRKLPSACLPYNSEINDSRTDVCWQNSTEEISEVNQRDDGAAGPQIVQEEGSGMEEHRSMRTDGGFTEQAQTEASKQLVTSDLHCKNGSLLVYSHILCHFWNGTNYFDSHILVGHQRAQEGAIRHDQFTDKTWGAFE